MYFMLNESILTYVQCCLCCLSTALVLSGAYKLAETSNKAPPIKPDQAVKFSNYLMSRKSVQVGKGVYYLLEAVSMFTSNK